MEEHHYPPSTPHRREFDDAVADFRLGQAIKAIRQSRGLTQTRLGELVGVKKARICSIEKGSNLTLSTLRRIFSALDIKATLLIGKDTPIDL